MPFKNMFMEKAYMLMSKKFKSLILMILTLTKYHENLLRDGTLSLLSIVEFFFFLGNQDDSKKYHMKTF